MVHGPPRLHLTRTQILAYRRAAQGLEARMRYSPASLRRAAWAGLQDSMPRAALLSIHARVDAATPTTWEAPPLVQVWGPRYSTYVVSADDAPLFTLARMPDTGQARRVAEQLADRLSRALGDSRVAHSAAAHALGEPPNRLRYATLTGRVRLRWDGARQPTIWMVPPPGGEPGEARRELARRYLHVFGPATPEAFAAWGGIPPRLATATFTALAAELMPVHTPTGDAWMLLSDESAARRRPEATPAVRLLPSGDTFFLCHRAEERALLVENASHREQLWTSRVWPGALLVDGVIVGTWRRADAHVSISPWRRLTRSDWQAVENEASGLPLPGVAGRRGITCRPGGPRASIP